MSRPTAFIYHEAYDGRGFSRLRDSWRRYALARDLLGELGFFTEALRLYRQEPASVEDIALVHDPAYIEHVRRLDELGSGCLDYGDTPAYHGVWRRALVAVGGTLLAARLVAGGEVRHAFNPGGGLHHARPERAGGFCVFNDVAVAVRRLQRDFGLTRIALVDLDGHHGDGTQAIFYDEAVLTISLHRYDGRFYPRTGRIDERGAGAGWGYNLNVPLPRGTDDKAYLEAVQGAVLPRLYAYRPQLMFVQIGADGHYGDPLVRLGLGVRAYGALGRMVHEAAHDLCDGRLVLVAGGGYRPEAVARCWTAFLAAVADRGDDDAIWQAVCRQDDPPQAEPTVVATVRQTLAELEACGALAEPPRAGPPAAAP